MKSKKWRVFENGCGKWVRVVDGDVLQYTSNKDDATVFDSVELRSVHGFMQDFYTFRRTLVAVPLGVNRLPTSCVHVHQVVSKIMTGVQANQSK